MMFIRTGKRKALPGDNKLLPGNKKYNVTRQKLDFTGDFGHETGILDFTFDATGLIINVDADLD